MKPLSLLFILATATFAVPLPSWNDTAPKKAIIAFVEKVTTAGSPDYVVPAERIATFDNDGTLWCEQPMYVQAFFVFDSIKRMAPQHPEWKDQEPFASVLKGDMKTALAGGEKALVGMLMASHSGMTTDEFEKSVTDWLVTAKHPKTGKMFAMSKPPTGDWTFQLDGSVPLNRIQHEIDELKVYLKRDWYPKHEVNLGDSWEFDPIWIKNIIHRDLAKAQTIATMRLRQIRRMKDRQIAIIDVSISSTGGDFRADGSESSGSVELKGEVAVNLNTMLDEFLELKGTITTSASPSAAESTTVTLPIHLTATKSFVRE